MNQTDHDTQLTDALLPVLLTVADAGRLLGIGRTLTYHLIDAWNLGDPTGIPSVRLGGCVRVPRWAFTEISRYGRVVSDLPAELAAFTTPTTRTSAVATRTSRRSTAATAQLTLLDPA